jgi:iron(III) transport system permease protein
MITEQLNARYLGYLVRSLLLSLLAASLICASALLLTYTGRRHKDRFTAAMIRIANLGYALPGTVLAVGLVIVISFMDGAFAGWTGHGSSAGPLLQGTVFTMVLAYLVRFMAGGYNSINSAMQRITPNMDEAAVSMGIKGLSLLRRVHVPLLKGGIMTAGMLVFVDVMKEMPITLMTRPFGWDTLAVKIYELTSEGEWERAALPAVFLILGGLIPIIFLNKQAEA